MARYSVKFLLAALLTLVGAPALAQNAYPLFAPSNGVMKGDVNTFVTSSATNTDIIALFTGTCDITTFLRGNGTCAQVSLTTNVTGILPSTNGGLGFNTVLDDTVPVANGSGWQPKAVPACLDSGGNHLNYDNGSNAFSCGTSAPGGLTGFANPTASVGLSAVNGAATTAMRSDAAPALSQSIAPTWTGIHTYGTGGSIRVENSDPSLYIDDTSQGADAKNWLFNADTGFDLYAVNDARSTFRSAFHVSRSAAAVSAVSLGNATDNPTLSFLGTGVVTSGGVIRGPSGTVGAPTYSFTGTTNTGVYSSAANVLSFAAAGSTPAEVTSLGINTLSGSNANPAYSFAGDPDTGVYRVGADQVGIATGGALKWQVGHANYSAIEPTTGALGSGVSVGVGSGGVQIGSSGTSYGAIGNNLRFTGTSSTYQYHISDTAALIDFNNGDIRFFNAASGVAGNNITFANNFTLDRASGSARIADGLVGTPSLSFIADTDTGLYRFGTNGISTSVGGVERFRVDGNSSLEVHSLGEHAFEDGAAALPGLTFNNDTNTGFYRIGSDDLGVSANGTLVFEWNAASGVFNRNGQFFSPNGSQAAPSLSFTSDTNTGFFSAGADTIGFSMGGVNLINATSSVFSTSIPIETSDGTAASPGFRWANDTNTGLYRIGADNVGMSMGSALTMDWLGTANGGARVADYGGTLQVVGFREVPQNSQSANYTAVLADSGKHLLHPNGGGAGDTFTIPANASVAYPIGTAITFVNRDSNNLSIAITTDTLILGGTATTGTRTLGQNGVATALKVESTVWIITGTGVT